MTDAAATPYDAVLYPGLAYDYTHPDRLATVASLHGLDAAPAPRCRVLELGCGTGGNVIPMAFQYPDSEFLGIDLSETAIAKGVGDIADLGLTNISLRSADIATVDAGYGRFDYIIAHGVYSWVPPAIREKMLAIFRDNLAPHGVVYVSYNSFPGSHLRNLTRDMMLYHVKGIDDPREQVAQARGIVKFLADASAKDSVYGAVLRDQFGRIEKMRDEVLFHDDLEESSAAFLLSEVVEDAGRHGLQYISDATFARTDLQHHSEAVVDVLDRLCGDDVVARHQYQDFIEGHGFRRTLLCHRGVALRRALDPQCIRQYLLAGSVQPTSEGLDPAADGVASFKTQTGATLLTDHRLSKAALLHLNDSWPRCIPYSDLLQSARQRLGAAAADSNPAEDEQELAGLLFRAARGGYVGIHLSPPLLTTTISERPQASRLARRQVLSGPMVTNQQHRSVFLEDAIVRCFLPLVDGTRTVDDLVADLEDRLQTAGLRADEGGARPEPITREGVEKNLTLLARMALLVA